MPETTNKEIIRGMLSDSSPIIISKISESDKEKILPIMPGTILVNHPINYPFVFESLQGKPWALLPAKLDEIVGLVESKLAGENIPFPEAAKGKNGNRSTEAYQIVDGVAVIPVYGVLDKRMNLFSSMSGGTSTELLGRDIKQALNDPQVDAILLDIESPGGAVDGTKELADQIYAARGQGKPIVAYANGLMASAAYWIGSAADAIVANETAQVGSIGVAMMHTDRSGQDERLGIKRTAIFAGKYKRIASDEKPLSEEGQAYLQSMADDYYQLFLDAVAKNRGVDPETAHKKMADGRLFIGMKALKAGLIDKIGNLDSALALAQEKGKRDMTKAELKEKYPELFKEVMDEGASAIDLEALRQKGRDQERARVMEILGAGADMKVAVEAIKDGISAEAAFKMFFEAEKAKRVTALQELEAQAPKSMGQGVIADEGAMSAAEMEMCQKMGISVEDFIKARKTQK